MLHVIVCEREIRFGGLLVTEEHVSKLDVDLAVDQGPLGASMNLHGLVWERISSGGEIPSFFRW
jgi:hypothetical protein